MFLVSFSFVGGATNNGTRVTKLSHLIHRTLIARTDFTVGSLQTVPPNVATNEAARLARVHVDALYFLQGRFSEVAHARMIGT